MRRARPYSKTRGQVRARIGRDAALRRSDQIRIGISGWRYAKWRGKFYPKGLPHRRELEYASRALNSVEINGSFYSLQRPSSYQRWYSETPSDFIFSVKGGRFITHMKKLRDVETPLANFFASGVLALHEKLGPILWQLPPNLGWNAEELYVSGYTDRALDRWAGRIAHWRKGKQPNDAKLIACAKRPAKRLEVFVYFDNDAKVYAPFDAQRLSAQLGVE